MQTQANEAGLCPEQVYLEFRGRVSGYIHGRVSNPADAEDVLSNVFLKVCQHLEDFSGERATLSTWIYAITKYTVIDYYRSVRHWTPLEYAREIPSGEDISDRVVSDARLEELAQALEQLRERERDCVILYHYKNLTLKQVAEQMGVSYGNIKIIHKRALDRLKKLMKE